MLHVIPWTHQSRRRKRHLDRNRPRYSFFNDRRDAQWRSQILLLSTATTSIYWSSQLERSDQLQQSAAIFSYKTRRVTVYVDSLQYSFEESVSHRRTRRRMIIFNVHTPMHNIY